MGMITSDVVITAGQTVQSIPAAREVEKKAAWTMLQREAWSRVNVVRVIKTRIQNRQEENYHPIFHGRRRRRQHRQRHRTSSVLFNGTRHP